MKSNTQRCQRHRLNGPFLFYFCARARAPVATTKQTNISTNCKTETINHKNGIRPSELRKLCKWATMGGQQSIRARLKQVKTSISLFSAIRCHLKMPKASRVSLAQWWFLWAIVRLHCCVRRKFLSAPRVLFRRTDARTLICFRVLFFFPCELIHSTLHIHLQTDNLLQMIDNYLRTIYIAQHNKINQIERRGGDEVVM